MCRHFIEKTVYLHGEFSFYNVILILLYNVILSQVAIGTVQLYQYSQAALGCWEIYMGTFVSC